MEGELFFSDEDDEEDGNEEEDGQDKSDGMEDGGQVQKRPRGSIPWEDSISRKYHSCRGFTVVN